MISDADTHILSRGLVSSHSLRVAQEEERISDAHSIAAAMDFGVLIVAEQAAAKRNQSVPRKMNVPSIRPNIFTEPSL